MPVSFALIFRTVVMLLLALHVFYMYCTARGMAETFGFHLATTIIACLFALAMLIPLVWAVALPEIPEAIWMHVVPRRRWKQGHCPACGYEMRSQFTDAHGEAMRCSECGTRAHQPPAWQVGPRTVALFVAINLLAWLIGSAAGESWMLTDERDFSRAVDQRLAAGNTAGWSRARRWPNVNCSLLYRYPDGIHATE